MSQMSAHTVAKVLKALSKVSAELYWIPFKIPVEGTDNFFARHSITMDACRGLVSVFVTQPAGTLDFSIELGSRQVARYLDKTSSIKAMVEALLFELKDALQWHNNMEVELSKLSGRPEVIYKEIE